MYLNTHFQMLVLEYFVFMPVCISTPPQLREKQVFFTSLGLFDWAVVTSLQMDFFGIRTYDMLAKHDALSE